MIILQDLIVLDCETYPNYFLCLFKKVDTGEVFYGIEIIGQNNKLSDWSMHHLKRIIDNYTTFGFNSLHFDLPVIYYALQGKTTLEIKKFANHIIQSNQPSYKSCKDYGVKIPHTITHFDLKEVAAGVGVSLKLYGARLNSKKLQDLPYEHDKLLTNREISVVRDYCGNDLETTIDLFKSVKGAVQLRFDMLEQYNDKSLLSKSDAQIAELVIKNELHKVGIEAKTPSITYQDISYKIPEYINFNTKQLQDIKFFIENYKFKINDKGSIEIPYSLKNAKIKIGNSKYQMGIGGLHSTESKQVIKPNENQKLIDKDVASYYPSIILNQGLYPKHLTDKFLEIYQGIVDKRLKAKREGNKIVDGTLKIVINGSFGKFGNRYSVLYSPDLLLQVTLTGQLCILMLIEKLEENGISVVSANTDGFVSLVDNDKEEIYEKLCAEWQETTKFQLEATYYKALYSRDVNNYIAVKTDGKHKGKGIFTEAGITKNPQSPICVKSVIEHLLNGTDIAETINECQDITQFICASKVTGGATYNGEYLGKVVRWIYVNRGFTIHYASNGNTVPNTQMSRPLMELPETIPDDLNRDLYIKEAMKLLEEINVYKRQLELWN